MLLPTWKYLRVENSFIFSSNKKSKQSTYYLTTMINNDDLSLQKPEKVFALNEITRLEKAVEKHFSVFYMSAYSQHERDRKIIFFFCMNHTNVLFSSFCRPSFSRKNLLLFLGYYKVIEKLDTFFPVQRKS